MADTKLVREYVVPLRREFLKVPVYRRTGKAARSIKIFIAKHMKVPERDINKVKLDVYLNNEIWCKGRTNPPSKVKVRATKEGDIVKVELVELPAHLKFLKAKHERRHKSEETKAEPKAAEGKTSEETKEEKTEEQKKDESEKEKAVESESQKEAKKEKQTQKHTGKDKKVEIHRRSMSRH